MANAEHAIVRAILSVSDKTGIDALARALSARGVEILSTGGTAKHLSDAGIDVTPISQWSGAPEILGGRVKTLTPKVFGAILHDRANADHVADVTRLDIPRIDLVVVNLYPFEQTVAREGVTVAEAIEQIDIGGPSMLRAAAKNHRFVLPLCDPSLYDEFLREFESGAISDAFRLKCAIAVFEKTSAYDAGIASFLSGARPSSDAGSTLTLRLDKFQDLRYGENPHQTAGFYVPSGTRPFEQLQGKELSYNNLLDLDAAIRLANAFGEPAAAVIKHTNPCGVARRDTLAGALQDAIASDPLSAFGGIIGVNRAFDGDCARAVAEMFLEVIVAPSFDEEAREILAKKKNLRLVVTSAERLAAGNDLRSASGGVLVQSLDRLSGRDAWKVVTERQPTEEERNGLEFAWIVCAHVKSNAIVLTHESQSVGIGAGQMSRVDAAQVAIMKSTTPAPFAASDAFFPFRDGLDILADAGVTAVIQPGGSVRDAEVIAAANERNIAMIFTGERHFRH
jgi:phosphoribosylaminoimidazolecarboxamide formyltransferase/IMP cyclohydrolase